MAMQLLGLSVEMLVKLMLSVLRWSTTNVLAGASLHQLILALRTQVHIQIGSMVLVVGSHPDALLALLMTLYLYHSGMAHIFLRVIILPHTLFAILSLLLTHPHLRQEVQQIFGWTLMFDLASPLWPAWKPLALNIGHLETCLQWESQLQRTIMTIPWHITSFTMVKGKM
jgi:hypothetical protein